MDQKDKNDFVEKIKVMLFAIDGTCKPKSEIIGAYALALKKFTLDEICQAIDVLISKTTSHITPAHIIQQIENKPKRSESESRSAAATELALPYWQRMGFKSQEAYEAVNHKQWLKENEVSDTQTPKQWLVDHPEFIDKLPSEICAAMLVESSGNTPSNDVVKCEVCDYQPSKNFDNTLECSVCLDTVEATSPTDEQ